MRCSATGVSIIALVGMESTLPVSLSVSMVTHSGVLIVISLATSIPESVKLSGAFGKGRILGVLMAFPVFKEISRFIFGNSAKSK